MSDLKLQPRVKPSPYTGSAFDTTLTMNIIERPGGHHHGPTVNLNIGAFSHCKKTQKPDPHDFTKRGTGHGGTVTVCRQDNLSPSPLSFFLLVHHFIRLQNMSYLKLLQRNIVILILLLHQDPIHRILN